jgi:hypothetical protein
MAILCFFVRTGISHTTHCFDPLSLLSGRVFSGKGRIFEQIKGAGCGNALEQGGDPSSAAAFASIF